MALGVVGIFWPNGLVEVAGFALILIVLGINWFKSRGAEPPLPTATV